MSNVHLRPEHTVVSGESTAVRNKYGPDLAFASHINQLEEIRDRLAREMDGRWVGAMPVETFLSEFLPPTRTRSPKVSKSTFRKVPGTGVEQSRYKPFIDVIQKWMPHFRVVNTSGKPDKENALNLKPDISVYKRVSGEIPPEVADFQKMEIWIEFKNKGVAFHDPPKSKSELGMEEFRLAAIERGSFTPSTTEGINARGQLVHYAAAVHATQFRHFSYSVLIEGNAARFLRWDPAGTTVTSAFNYRTNPQPIADFFWRFNRLSAKERGHDESVQPANVSPQVDARVREALKIEKSSAPLYQYMLPGLANAGYGYGPKSKSQNLSLVSRCSRTLPIYWIPNAGVQGRSGSHTEIRTSDEDSVDAPIYEGSAGTEGPFSKEGVIYMKDTWRFLSNVPGAKVEKEHEIYEVLHSHKTPNIPEHVAGGDVDEGKTRTQEFVNAPWVCVKVKITPYHHYRLVQGVVGRRLRKFKSTKELAAAVLDALKAHSHAFEHAKILHRDISPGNIIITDDGRGLLIDWEMAKSIDMDGSRRPGRTGTWQFMSADLLQTPGKKHVLADDLESFVHVLGWMVLRYVPTTDTYQPWNRAEDLAKFDECRSVLGHPERGGTGKLAALVNRSYPSWTPKRFQLKQRSPMLDLISRVCIPFRLSYGGALTDEERESIKVMELLSHPFFIDEMEGVLNTSDWPTDDKASLDLDISVFVGDKDNRPLIRTQNTEDQLASLKRTGDGSPQPKAKRRRGNRS